MYHRIVKIALYYLFYQPGSLFWLRGDDQRKSLNLSGFFTWEVRGMEIISNTVWLVDASQPEHINGNNTLPAHSKALCVKNELRLPMTNCLREYKMVQVIIQYHNHKRGSILKISSGFSFLVYSIISLYIKRNSFLSLSNRVSSI